MSDDKATPQIAVPDGWGEMTDDEKNAFVTKALIKIAADAGVDTSGPADDDYAETTEADTAEPDAPEAASRVFREPGL